MPPVVPVFIGIPVPHWNRICQSAVPLVPLGCQRSLEVLHSRASGLVWSLENRRTVLRNLVMVPFDVFGAFTNQQEISCYGLQMSPAVAIATDVRDLVRS